MSSNGFLNILEYAKEKNELNEKYRESRKKLEENYKKEREIIEKKYNDLIFPWLVKNIEYINKTIEDSYEKLKKYEKEIEYLKQKRKRSSDDHKPNFNNGGEKNEKDNI